MKPRVEFSSSIVSRWIKETLNLSGVNITKFKGHSTRTVPSSKIRSTGLLVSDVLNRGSWCQKSTWQRFTINQFLMEMRHTKKLC